MLFNKQATEIINLATNKDPELEQILKYALSKLTDGQKEKIKNGENFSIADFYDNGSCKNSVQFEIRPDYLDTTLQIVNYEENGESTEYELDVFGFDKQAVEDLDNETSIENLKKITGETKEDIKQKGIVYRKLATIVGIIIGIILI